MISEHSLPNDPDERRSSPKQNNAVREESEHNSGIRCQKIAACVGVAISNYSRPPGHTGHSVSETTFGNFHSWLLLHRHANCAASSTPKTNVEFWQQKFSANVLRDARNGDALKSAGWKVMTVWECETKKSASLNAQIKKICRALAGKNDRKGISTQHHDVGRECFRSLSITDHFSGPRLFANCDFQLDYSLHTVDSGH